MLVIVAFGLILYIVLAFYGVELVNLVYGGVRHASGGVISLLVAYLLSLSRFDADKKRPDCSWYAPRRALGLPCGVWPWRFPPDRFWFIERV